MQEWNLFFPFLVRFQPHPFCFMEISSPIFAETESAWLKSRHFPMSSRLMRSRRALLSCAHRLAFGKFHLENVDVVARGSVPSYRHMWTACVPREPEMRLWSRASFSRSKFASGYSALTPKTLEQIMKIETVIFATPQEITTIWNDVCLLPLFEMKCALLQLRLSPFDDNTWFL